MNTSTDYSPRLTASFHRPPYSDPFALPELPESETPALMDYAAGLGPGKRKRPTGEDDTSISPHGDKTVFITATTAPGGVTGVPIMVAGQIAASSYPTPEFSPETIGGIEMRVAESPAVKGRPRVRFNASGGSVYGDRAGLGSSEGSSAKGRWVRPKTDLGWFGPKLVTKPGGNDGRGEGSAGNGTTGSGSASGGGQGWVKRPKSLSSKSGTRSTE
jgi:hypothetical protein